MNLKITGHLLKMEEIVDVSVHHLNFKVTQEDVMSPKIPLTACNHGPCLRTLGCRQIYCYFWICLHSEIASMVCIRHLNALGN